MQHISSPSCLHHHHQLSSSLLCDGDAGGQNCGTHSDILVTQNNFTSKLFQPTLNSSCDIGWKYSLNIHITPSLTWVRLCVIHFRLDFMSSMGFRPSVNPKVSNSFQKPWQQLFTSTAALYGLDLALTPLHPTTTITTTITNSNHHLSSSKHDHHHLNASSTHLGLEQHIWCHSGLGEHIFDTN